MFKRSKALVPNCLVQLVDFLANPDKGLGSSPERKAPSTFQNTVGAYAVQCGECFKWRLISMVGEYEDIRATMIEDPFVCAKKAGVSCDDPGDVEYNTSRLWVIDKPNIPKTPDGFERSLVMRRDFSKMDAYYSTPSGKKVRACPELERFFETHPQYRKDGVSISNFSFAVPKILDEMVPRKMEAKGSASASKRARASRLDGD